MYEGFFDKRVALSDEVTNADSQGNSTTVYGNQPVKNSGELHEAALKKMVFLSSVDEAVLEQGFGQYQKRFYPIMDDADTITLDTTENVTASISNYAYNEPQSDWITPAVRSKQVLIGYVAQQRNIDNIDDRQMKQLSYIFADSVDQYIATALAAATEMSNTVRGSQLIYAGGKKTDATITSSDVMSIGLINEAETRLSQKEAFYWNSTVLTKSALQKNPWSNDADDPFVLVIGKQQKKAFRDSDLFLSAEQYGGDEVRLSGEIGRTIFGTRVVVSDNVPTTSKDVAAWDATTNTTVDLARCFLMKGMAAYTFVWGKTPEFEKIKAQDKLGDYLRVWGMYAGDILHADAIVKIDCATNVPLY